MTETTPAAVPGTEPPAAPASAWERADRILYAFEAAVIITALFVMTVTYVLTILRSNMARRFNKVDDVIAGIMGHSTAAEAPAATAATITNLWTPLVVGLLVFGLSMLAIRTRERVSLTEGEEPPPPNWPKRLLWAAISTAIFFALMFLTKWVATSYLIVLTIVLLGVVAVINRDKLTRAHFIGGTLCAGTLAYFFLSQDVWTHSGISLALMIYVGFIGASMATRDGRHIKVDAIRKSLKTKFFHLYNAIGDALTIVLVAIMLVMAVSYAMAGGSHEVSQLPIVVVVAPIVVAFAAMVLRFAGHMVRSLRAYRRGDPAPAPEVELH